MRTWNSRLRESAWLLLSIMSFGMLLIVPADAMDFGTLVKKVGGFSDDIEIKHLNQFAKQPSTVKAGRELFVKVRTSTGEIEKARLLRRAIQDAVGEVDPAIVKQLEQLDEADLLSALVLSSGARSIQANIPDIAARGRFLSDGGSETLCAIGRYGDLMEEAVRLRIALQASKLPSPAGTRIISLNDFGKFFYEHGDRAHHFWVTYVRPHWQLWLGSSALAAILIAPDEYLDSVGNLTEAGLQKIGEAGGQLLGEAMSGVVKGIGEGTKNMARETGQAFFATFLTSFLGLVSLVILVIVGLLIVPITRYKILGLLLRAARRNPR